MATLSDLLIKVGIDASTVSKDAVKAGQDAERGLGKADTTIRPDVDDKQAKSGIAGVVDMVEKQTASADAVLTPGVDDGKARTGIAGIVDLAESRAKGADATITPGIDGDRVRTGIAGVVDDAESRAKQADATIRPDVDGATARTGIGNVIDDAESRARQADAQIRPTVTVEQVRTAMADVVSTAESKAKAANPMIHPTVDAGGVRSKMADAVSTAEAQARGANAEINATIDSGKVRSQMAGAVSSAESVAKGADPTITPEVDGGEAKSGMEDLMGSLKDKAKTGGAAAGAVLVAALWDAVSAEADVDKVAAQLGLSKKQMDRLGKVAGNIFANNWASSVGEAADGVAAVMSSIPKLRIAGADEIERISTKALAFADIMQVDVMRAAQIAGQTVRTGLAKNADQAFDLLMAASQRVPANIREDLLDAADEYGPFFKALGISGEQAFNMLVKGSEQGMYGIDKTGDAIKEFTIRATDMSTSTKGAFKTLGLDADQMADMIAAGGPKAGKAFDMIVDGLRGIEDPQKRANTAIALFGTPLEDLGVNKIPKFLKSLDGMDNRLGKVPGTMKRAMDTASDNVAGDLKTMANSVRMGAQEIISGFLSGDWGKMSQGFTRVWQGLKSIVTEYWHQIVTFFGGIGTALLIKHLDDIWGKVKQLTSAAWNKVKDLISGALNKVKDVVGGAADKVRDVIVGAWDKIRDVTSSIWGRVRDAISGAWDKIRDTVSNAAGRVRDVVSGAWDKVRDVTASLWGRVRDAIGNVWDKIRDTVSNAAGRVRDVVSNAWDKVRDLTSNLWGKVRDVIGNVWDKIRDLVSNAAGRVRDVVSNAWDRIRDITSNLWSRIRELIGNAWDKIRDVVSNAASRVREVVSNAWDRVRDATSNAWSRVRELIGNAWDRIRDTVSNAAGRVREVVTGAWDRIRDATSNAWDRVRDIVSNAVGRVKDILSGLRDAIGRVPDAFEAAKKGIGRVWDGIKAAAARPVNFVINQVYNNGIRKALNLIPGVSLGEAHDVGGFSQGGWTGPGGEKKPAGVVHADEFVVKKRSRLSLEKSHPGLLDYMNRTGRWPGPVNQALGFAKGGKVNDRFAQALRWARSQVGDSYGWGREGPNSWDCSGFMSGITNFIRGGSGYGVRYGSTADFPWPGFKSGPGAFMIGSTPNYAGSGVGHMAGTLLGVNVESAGGVGVRVGPSARGAHNPHFTTVAHLGPGGDFGSAAGFGIDLGLFDSLFGSGDASAGSFFGAVDAVPKFIHQLENIWDKIHSMDSEWGKLIAHAPSSAMDEVKSYGLKKLKDAGAWGRDQLGSLFGDQLERGKKIWDTISGIDVPGFARGGIVTRPTLATLAEHGPEAVVPLPASIAAAVNNAGRNSSMTAGQMSALGNNEAIEMLLERIAVAVEEGGDVLLDSRVLVGEVTKKQQAQARGQRVAAGTSGWSRS